MDIGIGMKEQRNLSRQQAILFMILAAIGWSSGGILIKQVQWHPLAIAGTRSAIAALVMWAFLGKPKFTWSLPQVGGALAYAATVILFVTSTKLTTAANAILLQYTAPIYIAIFGAYFLKEKTTWLDWLTISVVLGGMGLFFLDNLSLKGFWGNLAAILSGVTFATLVIFLRKQKDGSPVETTFLGNIFTALVAVPFWFQGPPSKESCLGLVLLGVLQLGIPYLLYSLAIRKITALEATLIPVVEPILNPIWVFFFLGETPGPWALVGGLIVLLAVTLRCILVEKSS